MVVWLWLVVGWVVGVLTTGLALFMWSLILDGREQLAGWPYE